MPIIYVKPNPYGANPYDRHDRLPIIQAISGDTVSFATSLTLPDGTAATDSNSEVYIALAQTRFDDRPLWEGSWEDITEDTPKHHVVTLPDALTHNLRRGAYTLAIQVEDLETGEVHTPFTATLQIEYEATSPTHDIPYRRR